MRSFHWAETYLAGASLAVKSRFSQVFDPYFPRNTEIAKQTDLNTF